MIGSTHDSFILTNCMVGDRLHIGTVCDGWLLGECQVNGPTMYKPHGKTRRLCGESIILPTLFPTSNSYFLGIFISCYDVLNFVTTFP